MREKQIIFIQCMNLLTPSSFSCLIHPLIFKYELTWNSKTRYRYIILLLQQSMFSYSLLF